MATITPLTEQKDIQLPSTSPKLRFLTTITVIEVLLLAFGSLLGRYHFNPHSLIPQFFPRNIDFLFILTFYIFAFFPIIYAILSLFVVAKIILIFKNLFEKQNTGPSIVSGIISFLNPTIIGLILYRLVENYHVFFSQPSFAGFRSEDWVNGFYKNFETFSLILVAMQILLLAHFFKIKRITTTYPSPVKNAWPKAVLTFATLLLLVFVVNYSLNFLGNKKLNSENVSFRLSLDNSKGNVDVIKNFPIDNISTSDNSNIKFEWKNLPSGVQESSRIVVLYSNEWSTDGLDHLNSACTVQKDANKNLYYCVAYFSSLIHDYANKTRYSFFLDNAVQGSSIERDNNRKKDLDQLAAALQEYKLKNGEYPCGNGKQAQYGEGNCSDFEGTSEPIVFPTFNGKSYIDPLNDHYYSYGYTKSGNSFMLRVKLENSTVGYIDWYCADSDNLKVVTHKMPDPIVKPLSCNNLYTPPQ